MKKYTVFDNNGDTLDRYTIIDKQGEMLGICETGKGFNMFCGNCVDNYMFTSYGYGWRKYCDVKKIIKNVLPRLIEEFKTEGNIGKEINFSSLPKELKVIIVNRFENN